MKAIIFSSTLRPGKAQGAEYEEEYQKLVD